MLQKNASLEIVFLSKLTIAQQYQKNVEMIYTGIYDHKRAQRSHCSQVMIEKFERKV